MSALNKQVGGSHYKDKAMQPVELWAALNLNAFQGAIVKYITRHKEKNGAADIDKAEHFFALMLELEQAKGDGFSRPDYELEILVEYCRVGGMSEGEFEAIRNACFACDLATFDSSFEDEFRRALTAIRGENGYPVSDRG